MNHLHFTLTFFLIALLDNSIWCYDLNGPAVLQVSDPVDYGACLTFDSRTGLLYFVDLFEGRVLRYNYRTSTTQSIAFDGTVAPVIPLRSDPYMLIIGVNRSVYAVRWDAMGRKGLSQHLLANLSDQYPTSRLNDGKADKRGRLWLGTTGYEEPDGETPDEGVLYLTMKHNLSNAIPVIYPVNISNGLAWNKASNKLYFIDTPTFTVTEYFLDNNSGNLSNPRVAFNLSATAIGGYLNGMAIDRDDNLWLAIYSGGTVIKVNPRLGTVLQKVPIPATGVTSVGWGGPNLDVLFVATSRHALTPEDKANQPTAGALFAIKNLGTAGLPSSFANIKLPKVPR